MSKEAKTYRLSKLDIDYIDNMAKLYNIDNTKALEKIISEHRNFTNNNELSDKVAFAVINAFEKKIRKYNYPDSISFNRGRTKHLSPFGNAQFFVSSNRKQQ